MTKFAKILKLLADDNVEFVVIGGVSAAYHGSSYITVDLDICYSRDQKNLERLVNALQPIHPILRGAPPDLPFLLDVPTLKAGLNFTLSTDLIDLDLFGEVGGIGHYEKVRPQSVEVEIFGLQCKVLNLDALIASKKFAGREKDKTVVRELEAIREKMSKKGGSKQ